MYYNTDDSVVVDVEVIDEDVVLDTCNMRNITEEANFASDLAALKEHSQTAPSLAFLRCKREAERRASMSIAQRIGDFALRGAAGLAFKAFAK